MSTRKKYINPYSMGPTGYPMRNDKLPLCHETITELAAEYVRDWLANYPPFSYEIIDARLDLNEALWCLTWWQEEVLRDYYGFGRSEALTSAEICDKYQISYDRLGTVLRQSLKKLRNKGRLEVYRGGV